MKPIVLVSTTLARQEDAERLAGLLLEARLIACAQISAPIISMYRWEGSTTTATEFTLSLKTTPACTEPVKRLLCQEHPYQLPEIIVQEITNTSAEYCTWVYGEVRP